MTRGRYELLCQELLGDDFERDEARRAGSEEWATEAALLEQTDEAGADKAGDPHAGTSTNAGEPSILHANPRSAPPAPPPPPAVMVMDMRRFCDSLFELADLYARTLEADEYASLLNVWLERTAVFDGFFIPRPKAPTPGTAQGTWGRTSASINVAALSPPKPSLSLDGPRTRGFGGGLFYDSLSTHPSTGYDDDSSHGPTAPVAAGTTPFNPIDGTRQAAAAAMHLPPPGEDLEPLTLSAPQTRPVTASGLATPFRPKASAEPLRPSMSSSVRAVKQACGFGSSVTRFKAAAPDSRTVGVGSANAPMARARPAPARYAPPPPIDRPSYYPPRSVSPPPTNTPRMDTRGDDVHMPTIDRRITVPSASTDGAANVGAATTDVWQDEPGSKVPLPPSLAGTYLPERSQNRWHAYEAAAKRRGSASRQPRVDAPWNSPPGGSTPSISAGGAVAKSGAKRYSTFVPDDPSFPRPTAVKGAAVVALGSRPISALVRPASEPIILHPAALDANLLASSLVQRGLGALPEDLTGKLCPFKHDYMRTSPRCRPDWYNVGTDQPTANAMLLVFPRDREGRRLQRRQQLRY